MQRRNNFRSGIEIKILFIDKYFIMNIVPFEISIPNTELELMVNFSTIQSRSFLNELSSIL